MPSGEGPLPTKREMHTNRQTSALTCRAAAQFNHTLERTGLSFRVGLRVRDFQHQFSGRSAWTLGALNVSVRLIVEYTMKAKRQTIVFGGIGFCVGFTVCCLLFVPPAQQNRVHASLALPAFQVFPASAARQDLPQAKPQLPDWHAYPMFPTLPPQYPGYPK